MAFRGGSSVSQAKLKTLMKQTQTERNKATAVDHPLAKTNTAGQVVCILCKAIVKGDWNVHCQGLILLKQAQDKKKEAAAAEASKKRERAEATPEDEPQAKRPKVAEAPSNFFDNGPAEASNGDDEAQPAEEAEEESPGPKFNPDEIEQEVMQEEEPVVDSDDDVTERLPAGFFDNEPTPVAKPKKRIVRRPPPPPTPAASNPDDDYLAFQKALGLSDRPKKIDANKELLSMINAMKKGGEETTSKVEDKMRAGFMDIENVDVEAITSFAQDNNDDDYTEDVKQELEAINEAASEESAKLEGLKIMQRVLAEQRKLHQQEHKPVAKPKVEESDSEELDESELFDWRAKGV